jgi:EAL domain-containing protein (putative c-di-GMP-specific phosphodiesterase class I)
MQGYYFSVPVSAGELERLLHRNERLPLPAARD